MNVSHDVPDWGYSGRIVDYTTAGGLWYVALDKMIVIMSGEIWTLMIRDDSNGAIVTKDFEVEESEGYEIIVLPSAFPITIPKNALFVVGRKFTITQRALVTRVTTSANGLYRKINGIEYVSSVYTDQAGSLDGQIFNDADYPIVDSDVGTNAWVIGGDKAAAIARFTVNSIVLVTGNTESASKLYKVSSQLDLGTTLALFMNSTYSTIPSGALDNRGSLDKVNLAGVPTVSEAVYTDTATKAIYSRITATWAAAALACKSYKVWYQLSGGGPYSFIFVGEVLSSATRTMSFDIQFPLGSVLVVAIQTIGNDDTVTPLPFSPQASLKIMRQTNDDVIVSSSTFPAQDVPSITGGSITSGTQITFTAADLPTQSASKFEFRAGNWHGGMVLQSGASRTLNIKMNNIPYPIYCRALVGATTNGLKQYWSPGATKVMTTAVTKTSYTNLCKYAIEYDDSDPPVAITYANADITIDFSDNEGAEVVNCQAISWFRFSGMGMLQSNIDAQMTYISKVIELKNATAQTYVSIDVRILSYYLQIATEFFGGQSQLAFTGFINDTHLKYTIYLEYSQNGSSFSKVTINAAKLTSEIVYNAKYFRLTVSAESLSITDETGAVGRVAKALIEKIQLKFHRTTAQ